MDVGVGGFMVLPLKRKPLLPSATQNHVLALLDQAEDEKHEVRPGWWETPSAGVLRQEPFPLLR